jgi:hypothetical protein
MSKETFSISDIDTKVLLREIFRRSIKNNKQEGDDKLHVYDLNLAPTKIKFVEKHYEVIIPIGKYNHAKIYLTQDDVNVLNDLLEIKEAE